MGNWLMHPFPESALWQTLHMHYWSYVYTYYLPCSEGTGLYRYSCLLDIYYLLGMDAKDLWQPCFGGTIKAV